MKKLIALLSLILIVVSCKKETSNFIWERSFGLGNAFFVGPTPDSGLIGCGMMNGKPYLIKLSKEKSIVSDFTREGNGLFSSAWSDASCIIAGGSSNGKMFLSRISNKGTKVWDTTFTTSFPVIITSLLYTGSGNFLAVGSADPDSSGYTGTGLLFVRFDTTGQILVKNEIADTKFLAAGDAVVDNGGNIYLAMTRRNPGAKSKAGVAKYNSNFQKLWETDLYNNPDVTSVCRGIELGGTDSVYVTGKTEVARTEGTLDNSFIASLSKTGITGKKKYLENSNSGVNLVFKSNDHIVMLNKNCFFISIVDPMNGYNAERFRVFSACNAYNTDALGTDLDINYDGNILLAGSKGGNFYLALKSSSQ